MPARANRLMCAKRSNAHAALTCRRRSSSAPALARHRAPRVCRDRPRRHACPRVCSFGMGHAATALPLLGEPVPLVVPRTALRHAGFRAWVVSHALRTAREGHRGVRPTFIDGEVLLDMNAEAIHS